MNVDPKLKHNCEAAVAMIMREVKGVRAVVIATEDGFELASRVENAAEVSRLSAMASSMAALGAIAGEESRVGACDNVVIAAANGHIAMRQVRRRDVSLVVSVVASREGIVGQMLYFSRQACRALEAA